MAEQDTTETAHTEFEVGEAYFEHDDFEPRVAVTPAEKHNLVAAGWRPYTGATATKTPAKPSAKRARKAAAPAAPATADTADAPTE